MREPHAGRVLHRVQLVEIRAQLSVDGAREREIVDDGLHDLGGHERGVERAVDDVGG